MNNRKTTRRALVLSLLSLLVCCSMLVGTTFAWFTDSVQSGKNQIVAGNLDIELEYSKTMEDGSWKDVEDQTDLVNPAALWEPGHTEVVYLRLTNAGTLVLKYNFGITVANSIVGKSVLGNDIQLADYLKYGLIELDSLDDEGNPIVKPAFTTRDAARAEAELVSKDLAAYSDNGVMNPGDTRTVALVIYMPEEVDNKANYRGTDIPTIELGILVNAFQKDAEADSFGSDYDADSIPWDKTSTKEPQVVNGSYAISSPAELAWLAASTTPIRSFHLTEDIDMLNATITGIPLASYHTVNGNGKTISNVIVEGSGLFDNGSADGNIVDLTLDHVTVNTATGDYAGIVCGKYSGKLTNVTVKNSAVNAPNSEYVGGLAGAYYKNLVGCKVENSSVTGTEKVGGLIGFFTLADVGYSISLTDCSASNVTVTATNASKPYAGAIFGRGLATGSHKFTFNGCSAALQAGQVLIGQDYYNNIDTSAITVTTLP